MKSLLFKIGVGISVGINLFIFTALLYNINRYDERVEENRKWLKETIIEEVYKQIKFVIFAEVVDAIPTPALALFKLSSSVLTILRTPP